MKTLQTTFKNNETSTENPKKDFEILTRFVKEVHTLCVSAVHAFLILHKPLGGRSEIHVRSIRYGGQSACITCCSEVVNHFICTYATIAVISKSSNELENIQEQSLQDENTYSDLINSAKHRCVILYGKAIKKILFISGLHSSEQTVVVRFPESKTRWKHSFEEPAEYLHDEGDSHRTHIQYFSNTTNARKMKTDKIVKCT